MILGIVIVWLVMSGLALWLWAPKVGEVKAWDVPLVIIGSPIILMVLGSNWLEKHNPVIWRKK